MEYKWNYEELTKLIKEMKYEILRTKDLEKKDLLKHDASILYDMLPYENTKNIPQYVSNYSKMVNKRPYKSKIFNDECYQNIIEEIRNKKFLKYDLQLKEPIDTYISEELEFLKTININYSKIFETMIEKNYIYISKSKWGHSSGISTIGDSHTLISKKMTLIKVYNYNNNLRTIQTLSHEMGHVVDLSKIITQKEYYNYLYSYFGETLSQLFELLMTDYLKTLYPSEEILKLECQNLKTMISIYKDRKDYLTSLPITLYLYNQYQNFGPEIIEQFSKQLIEQKDDQILETLDKTLIKKSVNNYFDNLENDMKKYFLI